MAESFTSSAQRLEPHKAGPEMQASGPLKDHRALCRSRRDENPTQSAPGQGRGSGEKLRPSDSTPPPPPTSSRSPSGKSLARQEEDLGLIPHSRAHSHGEEERGRDGGGEDE